MVTKYFKNCLKNILTDQLLLITILIINLLNQVYNPWSIIIIIIIIMVGVNMVDTNHT